MSALEELNKAQMKDAANLPKFQVGDTVRVHFRIVEGEKERIQVFEGTVIGRQGRESAGATFTVRRVAYGEGVERVFPLHSPRVERVEVVRQGKVRRAKLYYLRDRVGKSARIKDRFQTKADKAKGAGKGKGGKQKAKAAAPAAAEAAPAAESAPAEAPASEE